MRKTVHIFRADISSSANVNNKNKDVLILGEGPTQGLDDTTLAVEAKYPISFIHPRKRFVKTILLWKQQFLIC